MTLPYLIHKNLNREAAKSAKNIQKVKAIEQFQSMTMKIENQIHRHPIESCFPID